MTILDQPGLIELPDEGEALVLTQDNLDQRLFTLLQTCLQIDGEGLEIGDPQPDLDSSEELQVIRGTASFLGVEDVDVRLELSKPNGQLQMRLTAFLPGEWVFGDSFANLAGFLSLDPLNTGYSDSYLNVLDFSNPTFELTSESIDETISDVDLSFEPGLNFHGTLALTGLLGPLTLIVDDNQPLLVSGLLIPAPDAEADAETGGDDTTGASTGDTEEEEPEGAKLQTFELHAIFPLSLGGETLAFKNPTLILYGGFSEQAEQADGGVGEGGGENGTDGQDPGAGEPPAEPVEYDGIIILDAGIAAPPEPPLDPAAEPAPVEETGAEPVDVSAAPVDATAARLSQVAVSVDLEIEATTLTLFMPFELGAPPDVLTLSGSLSSASGDGLSLAEISSAIGGADLEADLPESLQGLGGLALTQFAIGFSLAERTLTFVSIDVATTGAPPLTVIEDPNIALAELAISLLVEAPLRVAQRRVSATIDGTLALADARLSAHLELPSLLLSARLEDDNPIKVEALLNQLIGGVEPPEGEGLQITALDLAAGPRQKTFQLAAEIANVLTISLELGDIRVNTLRLSLDRSPEQTIAGFEGELQLFEKQFSLAATRTKLMTQAGNPPPTNGQPGQNPASWSFSGQMLSEQISLPDLILGALKADKGSIDFAAVGMQELALRALAFEFNTGDKTYNFRGGLLWDTGLDLGGGTTLQVDALVAVGRDEKGTLAGRVEGAISASISQSSEFLNNLRLSAAYTFVKPVEPPSNQSKRVEVGLQLGALVLSASYETVSSLDGQPVPTGNKRLTFQISGGAATFGALLTGMVNLIDPGVDDFELDPPWDLLNKIELPDVEIIYETTTRTIAARLPLKDNGFELVPGAFTITSILLIYRQPALTNPPPARNPPKLELTIEGRFFGNAVKPVWDPVNQPAPNVPSESTGIFELRYLGLGQHIAFDTVEGLDNITAVMNALKTAAEPPLPSNVKPLGPRPGDIFGASAPRNQIQRTLQFDAGSSWLIGAEFSLLDTLDLAIIFNDPTIYGMRLGLRGPQAQIFKGLIFEILYRRINDTIGVYHVELVLPDAMRQFQIGPAAITLPVVVVDIYTNGDFKLDFGFPWRGDFSRSFAIEVLIFMGAAGFYLNKLSAATTTRTPLIKEDNSQPIGVFNPVYEFGLGLKIGLGRTFNKGPLKAEISITLQGVIEGIVAAYNPTRTDITPFYPPQNYYMVKGGVSLVARLWGSVDFEVIKVEVEVLLRATVMFKVEVYEPTLVSFSAQVSVRASIEILFVTVHFSFDLTVTQSFTLGSQNLDRPWGASRTLSAEAASVRTFSPDAAAARLVLGMETLGVHTQLDWKNSGLPTNDGNPLTINLTFQPAFTRDANGVKGVGLLLIANSIPADAQGTADYAATATTTESDFDRLALELLGWVIAAGLGSVNAETSLDREELEELYARLSGDERRAGQPFSLDELEAFLTKRFVFRLSVALAATQRSASVFPMLPHLILTPGPSANAVNFSSHNLLTPDERQKIAASFTSLRAGHGSTIDLAPLPATQSRNTRQLSAAAVIFHDYFALLTRSVLQNAIDHLRLQNKSSMKFGELRAALNTGGQLSHLAAIVSRFLLHGLRLPWPVSAPTGSLPLYQLTGQQFGLSGDLKDFAVALAEDDNKAWVEIDPNGSTRTLNTQELATITALSGATLSGSWLGKQPELLPYYAAAPRRYNLRRISLWQAALPETPPHPASNETRLIVDLPETMHEFIASRDPLDQQAAPAIPGAAFSLKLVTPVAEADPAGPTSVEQDVFGWATRLKVELRRIPDPDGEGLLPTTYQLIGSDEAGKDLLEDLWNYLERHRDVQPQLFLLHGKPQQQGGRATIDAKTLVNADADALLIKTNLSTLSNPISISTLGAESGLVSALIGNPYAATLEPANAKDFARLIWECSTVNAGGFVLDYRVGTDGLPAPLFAADQSAELTLMILLDPPSGTPRPARRFHNCLVVPAFDDYAEATLYAESLDGTINILSIPPGNIGFQLTRPPLLATTTSTAPAAASPTPTAPDLLNNLYQLLGYQLILNRGEASEQRFEALPVGPAVKNSAQPDPDDAWLYERLVPVAKHATSSDPSAIDHPLPPAKENPYAGIGSTAELDFFWQDVFGNRLDDNITPATFDIHYSDPLVGINQWPTLTESYRFAQIASDPDKVALQIELFFDQHAYAVPLGASANDPELAQRVGAARASYERIFYQLSQPDVTLHVDTSVLDSPPVPLADEQEKQLLRFVAATWRYLSQVEQRLDPSRRGRTEVTLTQNTRTSLQALATALSERQTGMLSAADVAIANQSVVGLIVSGKRVLPDNADPQALSMISSPGLTVERWQTIIAAQLETADGETFQSLAGRFEEVLGDGQRVTVADVAAALKDAPGMLRTGVDLAVPPASLALTFSLDRLLGGKPAYPGALLFPVTVTVEIARDTGLVDPQALLATPDVAKTTAFLSPRTLQLTSELVFNAVDSDEEPAENLGTLREFARDFEAALPGLRLGLGSAEPHRHSDTARAHETETVALPRTPLWALRSGTTGVDYNIDEKFPYFFALAPLANTLLAGSVAVDTYKSGAVLGSATRSERRVEAIDLDALARQFLEALETFLGPESVVPATRLAPAQVHALLGHKQTLADAIARGVTNLFTRSQGANADSRFAQRRSAAVELLRQQLLINLREGYDIETILQYRVDVSLDPSIPAPSGNAPNLYGKPIVKDARFATGANTDSGTKPDLNRLGATLSAARVALTPGGSNLTFFFNTRTPEQLEGLVLDLAFRASDLEYDIVAVPGINDYTASSWLSFILPDDNADSTQIGEVEIPVPLRSFPIPPSLVLHRAEADPDSLERLQDLRQWQYSYVYEHLDIAQDAIETRIDYNLAPPPLAKKSTNGSTPLLASAELKALFDALVNFSSVYPDLAVDLKALAEGTLLGADAQNAVDALARLAGAIAGAWAALPADAREQDAQKYAETRVVDFRIEEDLEGDTKLAQLFSSRRFSGDLPMLESPGFRLTRQEASNLAGGGQQISYHYTRKPADAEPDPVLGESSIPDRLLRIPDLDIIEQQSAWSAIWLTRNARLVTELKLNDTPPQTNPVFVYQTPVIRFANNLTPLLVNTRRWFVDSIDAVPGAARASRTLAEHLQSLFSTLLPATSGQPYEVQLTCRYSFVLASDAEQLVAENDDLNELVAALPVLLGPRLRLEAGEELLAAGGKIPALISALDAEIVDWIRLNRPLQRGGMLLFALAIFAAAREGESATSMPLLRIEDLRLPLAQINDLADRL